MRSVVFHPGGKLLLSAADDKTIRVWELRSKRCTKTIDAHASFVSALGLHYTRTLTYVHALM